MAQVLFKNVVALMMLFSAIPVVFNMRDDLVHQWEVACPSRDLCGNRNENDPTTPYDCECEPTCARRGTCCLDTPYQNVRPGSDIAQEKCLKLPIALDGCRFCSYWVVSKCDPQWQGSSDVKAHCEGNPHVFGEFRMLVPAVNPVSGYTYLNYFCAVCNNDHYHAVLLNVTYESKKRMNFMELDRDGNHVEVEYDVNLGWGYWKQLGPGEFLFNSVTLIISKPLEEKYFMRICNSDIISDCLPYWNKDDVKEKCDAYMSIVCGVSGFKRPFKNVYCAECNYAAKSLSDTRCELFNNRSHSSEGVGLSMTYNHLHSVDGYGGSYRINICEVPINVEDAGGYEYGFTDWYGDGCAGWYEGGAGGAQGGGASGGHGAEDAWEEPRLNYANLLGRGVSTKTCPTGTSSFTDGSCRKVLQFNFKNE